MILRGENSSVDLRKLGYRSGSQRLPLRTAEIPLNDGTTFVQQRGLGATKWNMRGEYRFADDNATAEWNKLLMISREELSLVFVDAENAERELSKVYIDNANLDLPDVINGIPVWYRWRLSLVVQRNPDDAVEVGDTGSENTTVDPAGPGTTEPEPDTARFTLSPQFTTINLDGITTESVQVARSGTGEPDYPVVLSVPTGLVIESNSLQSIQLSGNGSVAIKAESEGNYSVTISKNGEILATVTVVVINTGLGG